MSTWIDKKYISLFGHTARNFKWKSSTLANCSCPICGDSSSNKLKARLYFIERGDNYYIHCHNCSAAMIFRNFLKQQNPALYDSYTKEAFLETTQGKQTAKYQSTTVLPTLPKFLKPDSILSGLKRVSQLKDSHPAKQYVKGRRIPSNCHYKLLYAPRFKQWINSLIPNKFNDHNDHPRLVIPFIDQQQNVFAVQGRAFGKEDPKYYTIIFDTSKPKIYGLNCIDFDRQYFVVEGPIDSLFVKNCLAMGGSDVQINESHMPNINTNAVFVYDNEPRNQEIVKKIEKTLKRGFKTVIWPPSIDQKDINEMIMSGMTASDIDFILRSNVCSGLSGLLKFGQWCKV